MVLKMIFCFLLIGAAAALCVVSGFAWQSDRGRSWGESYMKEYGLEPDKKDE